MSRWSQATRPRKTEFGERPGAHSSHQHHPCFELGQWCEPEPNRTLTSASWQANWRSTISIPWLDRDWSPSGYPRNPHPDTVDLVTKYNEERGLPFRYKKLEFGVLAGMKIRICDMTWLSGAVSLQIAQGQRACICTWNSWWNKKIMVYEICLSAQCKGDTRDQDILKELDGALQFIHDAKTGDVRHRVLVNCAQGVSRSASVTIAYLMKCLGMSWPGNEALGRSRSQTARRVQKLVVLLWA